jgi:replicative DNA helicase
LSTPHDSDPRRAPYNLDAEKALLGAILIDNEAHEHVSDFLGGRHFYDALHAAIYETAGKLIAAGKPATPATLRTFFENAEPIDAATTVPLYLVQLVRDATTTRNAREYARTVHDLATRRQLILIGEDMANAAYDSPVDFPPREQIEEAERRLYALAEERDRGQVETDFAADADEAMDLVRDAHEGKNPGLPWWLKDLQAKTGGLQPTDLIVVAGRPSMGKSAFATNLAYRLARAGTAVGFFSLEMSKKQVTTRIISDHTGISATRATRGELHAEELARFGEGAAEVSPLRIFTDATGGLSIAQLSARARRMKRKHNIGAVIVDYLQLMAGDTGRSDNRVQEVTQITMGLKALAKELKVPVVALSQLSRAVENRNDKRPQLADLRESGSIEQDADIVICLYRHEYYVERNKPSENDGAKLEKWKDEMIAAGGKAEAIIAKQRHGPICTVELQYDGALTRFSDLAHSSMQAPQRASQGAVYSASNGNANRDIRPVNSP